MAKKQYAVLCDTSIGGTNIKAGSIVILDEKEGASYKGALDPAKAACDYYAAEYGSKPIDLTAAPTDAEKGGELPKA